MPARVYVCIFAECIYIRLGGCGCIALCGVACSPAQGKLRVILVSFHLFKFAGVTECCLGVLKHFASRLVFWFLGECVFGFFLSDVE